MTLYGDVPYTPGMDKIKRDRIEIRLPVKLAQAFRSYAAREAGVSEVLRRYIRWYVKKWGAKDE